MVNADISSCIVYVILELPDMDNTDHQWPQASQHKLYFNTDPQSLNNVFDNPSENQSLSSNVVSSHQGK